MITASQVQDQLSKGGGRKRGLFTNLLVLVVSLLLFIRFGLVQSSTQGIVIIVLVLFIHEAGHFLGMKLFGYRDVQMFFIPFFGAAVAGTESRPSAAKQAIVALLGPVPGMLLAVPCAVLYIKTREPVYWESARTLLFLNAFNLIPLYPLDGGRVLEALLFARRPKLEVAMRFIAVLGLGGLAYLLRSVPLGVLAFFQLGALKPSYISARLADQFSKEMEKSGEPHDATTIPPAYLERMMPDLATISGERDNQVRIAANWASVIWRKTGQRPPSLRAGAGLMFIYLVSLVAGFVAPRIFTGFNRPIQTQNSIEQRLLDSGAIMSVEVRRIGATVVFECPVNSNGYYHGVSRRLNPVQGGNVQEATWRNGYLDGEWISTDGHSNVTELTRYNLGRATQYLKRVNGSMVIVPEMEWPKMLSVVQTTPAVSEAYLIYKATIVKTGDSLPPFYVKTLTGMPINNADTAGSVAWIHFFAISNDPTAQQMRTIEHRVWARLKSPDFKLIAIACDTAEGKTRDFAVTAGITFPLAADPYRLAYDSFATDYLPRDFLISPDGVVVAERTGFMLENLDGMANVAESLLRKINPWVVLQPAQR